MGPGLSMLTFGGLLVNALINCVTLGKLLPVSSHLSKERLYLILPGRCELILCDLFGG